MSTNKGLFSFNVSTNEPENLDPKQKSLCKNLDALNNIYSFCGNKNPSELYQGAIFAMRKGNQGNSDWMAQAAHSLRDIIFGVKGDGSSEEDKKNRLFRKLFLAFLKRTKK